MASRSERVPWTSSALLDARRFATAPLAIAGLLATGAVIYVAQQRGLTIVLLGLCAACLGLLVVVKPPIGLLATVLTSVSLRVTLETGTDSPIVASLVCATMLIAGWVVHQLLYRRPLMLLPAAVTIPAALLAGAVFISFFWGRATLDPRIVMPENFYRVQIAQASLYIVGIGLLFVGADMLRSPQLRTVLVAVIIVTGALVLPFRAFSSGLTFLNTAGLFGTWFVAICWSQALINRRLSDVLRVILGLLAVAWFSMAFFVEGAWVSGWLPALIALLLTTVVARPRLGLICCMLAIVAFTSYYSLFYALVVTQQQSDGSLGGEFGRIELWQRAIEVIQGRVALGTGPAGYALYYITFVPEHAMSTHSNFIDVLAQMGIIGLLSFAALLFGLWRLGVRTLGMDLNDPDRAVCAAVVGALPAVAFSLWLGDWLVPFVYNQTIAGFDHAVYSWLMLAALCGLYAQHRFGKVDDGAA